jgi:hypothetical protein
MNLQPKGQLQLNREFQSLRALFSGAGWKEIAPTDAGAPGRSHQPCGGCRGTPSPSTLAECYAVYVNGQGRPGSAPVGNHVIFIGPATFCLSTLARASVPIQLSAGVGRLSRVCAVAHAISGSGHNLSYQVLNSRMRFAILAHLGNCAEQQWAARLEGTEINRIVDGRHAR